MSFEKEPFHAHPDFMVSLGEDPPAVIGHIHGSEGMSPDEMRHRVADEHGADPADISVINHVTGEVTSAPSGDYRRPTSWGFSKWGAKWEPTGPKGDPNLN